MRNEAKDFFFAGPGEESVKAPDDDAIAKAREAAAKDAGRFRGFSRQATIAGAIAIAALVVVMGESAPKSISSTITMLALVGALAAQYAIGYEADRRGVSFMIARQEEISMTVVLAVSLLGVGWAVLGLASENAVGALVVGVAGWVATTLALGWAYTRRYLPQKREAFDFLAGFEETAPADRDRFEQHAKSNPTVESWLAQVRHRKTALTHHEARYLEALCTTHQHS